MKSKLKKYLRYVFITIMGIMLVPMVNTKALTLDDTLVKDTSYHFQSATVKWSDWSTWVNAPEYPIKRVSDGAYVYCIEAHIEFKDGEVVHGYTDEHSQLILSNLTRDELRRIRLYAYYGYGYNNHTDLDWYAATQYLIWEITEKEMAPWPVAEGDKTLTRIDKYDAKMNEIRSLVDSHYDTVSFDGQEITIKTGETIRLTDTNGVLGSHFQTPISTSQADFRIEGNDLVITAKKGFEGKVTLQAIENLNPPMIYATADQKCLSIGDPSYLEANITLNITTRFEVEKVFGDKDFGAYTPEEGAVFEIYDSENNLVGILTSDEDGKAFTYLRFGEYTLVQKTGEKNYKFIEPYHFKVDGSKTKLSVYLKNEKIKIEFHFRKEDADTGKGLAGAEIEIYDGEELIYTGTTLEDGTIVVKDINLEVGKKYRLTEKVAPDGYDIAEDIYFEYNGEEIVSIVMKDKKLEIQEEIKPEEPKQEVEKVPDTGVKELYIAELIGLVLFFAGLGGVVYVIKRKRENQKQEKK